MTDAEIIDRVLKSEGSTYTNDPDDRGKATRFGITLATLAAWRGVPTTEADVQRLTEDEARQIYARKYIADPGFDSIADDRLRALVVDSGVNHGPKRATKWLQAALGVKDDGVFGPETLRAIRLCDPAKVHAEFLKRRIVHYGALISTDHSQAKFALGWARRVAEFVG